MSVGDEIVSGQRLDTNTQWICQSLGELGIEVAFHSTVGDNLEDHVLALQVAIARADIVVMTGGLGPTADDLTREALTKAVGLELEFDEDVLKRIQAIYQRHGRVMPASNRAQAYFPRGSVIVPNPEGTAPGIDLTVARDANSSCRIFALPGVPVEMKQMWHATIEPELKKTAAEGMTFHHHVLHSFGAGESTVESMLPDLVRRGRDPQVGITASAATISLRISTRGNTKADCFARMQPTIALVRERLGDLVFGENGETLEDVTRKLLISQKLSIAIADLGFQGEVARSLSGECQPLPAGPIVPIQTSNLGEQFTELLAAAHHFRGAASTDLALVIGLLDHDDQSIELGRSFFNVALVGPDWSTGGTVSAWRTFCVAESAGCQASTEFPAIEPSAFAQLTVVENDVANSKGFTRNSRQCQQFFDPGCCPFQAKRWRRSRQSRSAELSNPNGHPASRHSEVEQALRL